MRCLLCCFLLLFIGNALAQSDTLNRSETEGKNFHTAAKYCEPQSFIPSRKIADTINLQNKQGRQGHWIIYGIDRPEKCYSDSAKYEEGNYVDGRRDGTWVRYNCDGSIYTKTEHKAGLPYTLYTVFNDSDTVRRSDEKGKQGYWVYYGSDRPESGIPEKGKVEEGTYINDRKEGKWIKYHDDGVHPKIMGHYVNNRPKGEFEKYYISGQLKEKGNFEKNIYHDTLTRYREDGTIEFQAVYDSLGKEMTVLHSDLPTGLSHTEYTTDCSFGWENRETPPADTLNRSDEKGKQGHWIYYGRDRPDSGVPADGKVEEGNYVDDRKEGTWIKYHNDGKTPKLKGYYKNNRPQGHYTRGNIDGSFRDSGDFSNMHRGSYDSLRRGGAYDYSTAHSLASGSINPGNELPDSLKLYPPQISATPNMGPHHAKPFQPNGFNTIYNEDDAGWMEGTFKNGQLSDGKVYFYDSDGILLGISVYRDGKYVGEGQL